MCGLDCTMNVLLDTHGRVIDVVFGSHPEAHREAIRRFNAIYAYESFVPEHGQADIAICGVFAPTDHLFFHTGWGCMSADLVVKDGGTLIYCSPVAGRLDRDRRLPGLRADGPDEAVHAADARELPARPARHPRARDPDVGGLHLGADLRGDDAQAPDDRHARGEPRDGRGHRPRRDDLDRRGARRGVRSDTGRTRRSSCCRTRATSCRATRCAWITPTSACSRTRARREMTDVARRTIPGLRASGAARGRRRRRARSAARRRSSSCSGCSPTGAPRS